MERAGASRIAIAEPRDPQSAQVCATTGCANVEDRGQPSSKTPAVLVVPLPITSRMVKSISGLKLYGKCNFNHRKNGARLLTFRLARLRCGSTEC